MPDFRGSYPLPTAYAPQILLDCTAKFGSPFAAECRISLAGTGTVTRFRVLPPLRLYGPRDPRATHHDHSCDPHDAGGLGKMADHATGLNSRPTLSVCMIVKDEEQLLPAALESVQPIADEVVVCVDSRTTDHTRTVAQAHHARVYDFDWEDDFSKARNVSLSKASKDWVLVIDADDRVTPFGQQVIPQCLSNLHPGAEGYRLHIGEYTMRGEFIFEDVSTVRLFPRTGYAYVHRIHENVYFHGRQLVLIGSIDGGISIAHVGYDPAHYLARHKDERNMALLLTSLEDDPFDFYSAYFLAKQHHEMGRNEEAARAARIALELLPPGAYTDDAELELEFLAGQDVIPNVLEPQP